MGSFSRTAEQKATPHLEKGKKKQTNVTRKKYCTMVGFQLKAAALLAVLATTQCLANDVSSSQSPAQASHSAYFTEMMVQSPSLEPAKCSDKVLEARKTATVTQGVKPTVSLQAALLIFLGVGIFAVFIAQAFQMVRKYVYRDADNLDTAFDAGGKVSIGFIMLKTRAPGAKTFLQVIKARFGARTHLVFCTFAFFTNLIVMMSLTVAGTAVLNSLVADLSPELAAMLLAVVIGGYTLIGGLGATFYVSYFNTALIFFLIILLMVEVFFNPFEHVANPFGSSKSIFEFVACWKAPDTSIGNHGGSYLTFFSSGGLVFGIVNLVGNFGTVFCDQAYWQSSVAAKPLQGVWGFIAGGLCWFAIPFGLATTMGLAYLGLSSAQGAPLLSDEDVMKGLAAPLVAQKLLGPVGEYSMLFLILMAVMSTGSAEIIAVASIVIYDVYQTYICPFRRDHKEGQCILCGRFLRQQKEDEGRTELCSCPSAESCEACKEDTLARAQSKNVVKPHYTCKAHGAFKEYQEHLLNYKNWCIILCTFLSIPLCLFCWAVDLNLAWTYYFTGILLLLRHPHCHVHPLGQSHILRPGEWSCRRLPLWNGRLALLRLHLPWRPLCRHLRQEHRGGAAHAHRQHGGHLRGRRCLHCGHLHHPLEDDCRDRGGRVGQDQGHRQPALPLGDQVQGRVEPGRRGELPRPPSPRDCHQEVQDRKGHRLHCRRPFHSVLHGTLAWLHALSGHP